MADLGAAVAERIAGHLASWPGKASAGAVLFPGTGSPSRSAGAGSAGQLPFQSGARLHDGSLACSAGAVELPLPWASVSKLLVAQAAMVAVEEGTASLDDRAGPDGSTLAHLLAHASGLPFEGARPVAPPGRRRIYSNSGVELAAAHLEARTGMAFADYLRAGVLEPLGMSGTTLSGSPAHGARGPLADLLALAAEMAEPTLVSLATWHLATSVAFPALVGVVPGFGRYDPCDWGLGPEIRGQKQPHWTSSVNSPATFGHFGQSGSFVWVDPLAGVALAGLSSEPFGAWAKQAWPELSYDIVILTSSSSTGRPSGGHVT